MYLTDDPLFRGAPEHLKTYLGDGAYCVFDGNAYWLMAERDGLVHKVALEPPGVAALVKFRAGVKAAHPGVWA